MEFLDTQIAPLGMGCWPIGGPMFSGDQSLGYSNAEDGMSIRTIHAALDGGITLFDTAAAYGAGHSERLLAQALADRPDAMIVTKIGIGIDEQSKQLSFDMPTPEDVQPAIEACLTRLNRDRIDLVLLHQNEMPIAEAAAIFDAMEEVRQSGKIRAFGWSTDFSDRTAAMAKRDGFVAIEHAMNVFFDAENVQTTARDHGLARLIRSPLAMGVLTGKYGATERLGKDDIRASGETWMEYFKDGRANPDYLARLDAVRELLCSDGGSLVQGALGWIWAKAPDNIPIPGARTEGQITEIAGALAHGPLSAEVLTEIEAQIDRASQPVPERPR
ncbi:aldo/keto reductase [Dinoroseobacter sp. S375]|uniref:aldo/keto reductase n=1 Tax=Dinoroseobacter sp. S375 TaxID=3415136 RepID=UPI003C7B1150